jgi:uncharacterized protein YeaO (DUF488 family)
MGESACYAHLLDENGRVPDPPRIRTERVYEVDAARSEERVLVDRLWPRGIRKESLKLTAWAKDLAPSHELRRWFHAHPSSWDDFASRYRAELTQHRAELDELAGLARRRPVVLLYAARDREHNQALLLKEMLERLIAA